MRVILSLISGAFKRFLLGIFNEKELPEKPKKLPSEHFRE